MSSITCKFRLSTMSPFMVDGLNRSGVCLVLPLGGRGSPKKTSTSQKTGVCLVLPGGDRGSPKNTSKRKKSGVSLVLPCGVLPCGGRGSPKKLSKCKGKGIVPRKPNKPKWRKPELAIKGGLFSLLISARCWVATSIDSMAV
jgi:hypothetical protein